MQASRCGASELTSAGRRCSGSTGRWWNVASLSDRGPARPVLTLGPRPVTRSSDRRMRRLAAVGPNARTCVIEADGTRAMMEIPARRRTISSTTALRSLRHTAGPGPTAPRGPELAPGAQISIWVKPSRSALLQASLIASKCGSPASIRRRVAHPALRPSRSPQGRAASRPTGSTAASNPSTAAPPSARPQARSSGRHHPVEDRLAVLVLADLQEGRVLGRLDEVAFGVDQEQPHLAALAAGPPRSSTPVARLVHAAQLLVDVARTSGSVLPTISATSSIVGAFMIEVFSASRRDRRSPLQPGDASSG